MTRRSEGGVGIVIPLRSFANAKGRLADVLDDDARRDLAQSMAGRVVTAAASASRIAIVSSAPEVRAWATSRGLDLIDDPGSLNGAARAGRAWARTNGYERYVIAHADLPRATTFDAVLAEDAATVAVIVPDHRNDGTPVLSLPTAAEFAFAYGPGSAALHEREATRLGLTVRIVRDADLAFDVDTPADLDEWHAHEREPNPIRPIR